MPRFEESTDQRGINVVVDGFKVPFHIIKDTSNNTIYGMVCGGGKLDFTLDALNLAESADRKLKDA